MRQHVYQVCHTRYQVLFYLREIGPVLKHCKSSKILWPGLYVVLNQWVNYVLFKHILTSVVHGCPVKQMNPKILRTLLPKNLCWSSLLTSCKPKACNCINIENSAQVFFSNSCEVSQNSLLQNNRERLLLVIEYFCGKIYTRNQ